MYVAMIELLSGTALWLVASCDLSVAFLLIGLSLLPNNQLLSLGLFRCLLVGLCVCYCVVL